MENTPDFSAPQAEVEDELAALLFIAEVKLETLRRYQRHLLALRNGGYRRRILTLREHQDFYFPHAMFHLLLECRYARSEYMGVLRGIANLEAPRAELPDTDLLDDESWPF